MLSVAGLTVNQSVLSTGISLRPSGISYHWVAVTVAVVIILLVGLVTYLCCMYRY